MRFWSLFHPSLAFQETSCGMTTQHVASSSYNPGLWWRRVSLKIHHYHTELTTHWVPTGNRLSFDFSFCVGAKSLWRNSESCWNWRSDTSFQILRSGWNVPAHVWQKKPKKQGEMCADSMNWSEALKPEAYWEQDVFCLEQLTKLLFWFS